MSFTRVGVCKKTTPKGTATIHHNSEASVPKSNASYLAIKDAEMLVRKTGDLPVPLHIRNAPTKLMKNLDYGKGYKYSHDHEDGLVLQEHLPPELAARTYYNPTNRGYEAVIKDRLVKWRRILENRKTLQRGDK